MRAGNAAKEKASNYGALLKRTLRRLDGNARSSVRGAAAEEESGQPPRPARLPSARSGSSPPGPLCPPRPAPPAQRPPRSAPTGLCAAEQLRVPGQPRSPGRCRGIAGPRPPSAGPRRRGARPGLPAEAAGPRDGPLPSEEGGEHRGWRAVTLQPAGVCGLSPGGRARTARGGGAANGDRRVF